MATEDVLMIDNPSFTRFEEVLQSPWETSGFFAVGL